VQLPAPPVPGKEEPCREEAYEKDQADDRELAAENAGIDELEDRGELLDDDLSSLLDIRGDLLAFGDELREPAGKAHQREGRDEGLELEIGDQGSGHRSKGGAEEQAG